MEDPKHLPGFVVPLFGTVFIVVSVVMDGVVVNDVVDVVVVVVVLVVVVVTCITEITRCLR